MANESKSAWKKPLLWGLAGLLALLLIWQLLADRYQEEEKALRSQVRERVVSSFPQQQERFAETIGLFAEPTGERGVGSEIDLSRPAVVLIHGLDDPGKVWNVLAPELLGQGFNVWQLRYPNDQPVTESAQLLFNELAQLKTAGVRQLALVAHSMGGLVSRELLTSPQLNYRAARGEPLPEVTSLTMVGTPNHGSQLARFRLFAEARDQLVRLSKGEASWLAPWLDGGGEAKIDLLPGSHFLRELNARPHPEGVELLVIAGMATPWSEADLATWANKLPAEGRSAQAEKLLGDLSQVLLTMSHGLGDGLVTVDSARLEGVPLLTVPGTHLSMIRNVTDQSQRVPPAVPIIVERLLAQPGR